MNPEIQPRREELDFMEWGILNWDMIEAFDDEVDRLCRMIDKSRLADKKSILILPPTDSVPLVKL